MSGRDSQPTGLASNERSLFECWAKTQNYDLCRYETDKIGKRGDYIRQVTHLAWSAWQGRASMPTVETPDEAPHCGTCQCLETDGSFAPKTSAPICPTCKTQLAFEGDICGLCNPEFAEVKP